MFMLSASIFPFSSYLLSLSLLGAPHVYYELVYIRKHIATQLPASFMILVLSILSFLVIVKTFHLIHPLPAMTLLELLCLFSLLFLCLYYSTNWLTSLVLAVFTSLLIFNAALLLVILAFLHNLTPWGFLSVQKASSRAWVLFIVNPCAVFLLALYLTVDAPVFSHREIHQFLSHYILNASYSTLTIAWFAAAVYLQMIHYYFVLRVLPNQVGMTLPVHLPVLAVFVLFSAFFFYAFSVTRTVYGIAALFHAYLEIPLLLYLLPLIGKLTANSDQITNIVKK
ncbi:hypothetical protein GH742_03865 [Legionella sp. MW5194]|nr:hypothetical protein GH742_03865 [Legionella sp. MW5194]